MDAEEEDAVFQAGPVLGEEEVDVREFRRREECLEAQVRVHEDGVAVEPAGVYVSCRKRCYIGSGG